MRTIKRLLAFACACACWWGTLVQAAPLAVVYPGHGLASDTRGDYYVDLLKLALSKTEVAHTVRASAVPTSESRSLDSLAHGQEISVIWGPTTRALEKQLLPVRVPLDKGILGRRIVLIRRGDQARFSAIASLDQLKAYSAGLQRDWGDVAVLRANGLPVDGAASYDTMFQMLAVGRFQYFPRGISEVWDEQRKYASLGIEVEQTLALHYPSNTYFFVNKKNTRLHDLIEQGLNAAIRDGSFEKLFKQYNEETIKRANLAARTVFELRDAP